MKKKNVYSKEYILQDDIVGINWSPLKEKEGVLFFGAKDPVSSFFSSTLGTPMKNFVVWGTMFIHHLCPIFLRQKHQNVQRCTVGGIAELSQTLGVSCPVFVQPSEGL